MYISRGGHAVRYATSLIALLLIAGHPVQGQSLPVQIPDQYFKVVPGSRLGPIALGDTPEALFVALGIPQGRAGVYLWELQPPLGTLVAITDQSGRITKIKTYWTVAYQTPNHLHVGLMESDITAALGRALWVARWSHYRALYYPGIFFQIDEASQIVMALGVVRRGTYAAAAKSLGR
jgi:hypothetical protein